MREASPAAGGCYYSKTKSGKGDILSRQYIMLEVGITGFDAVISTQDVAALESGVKKDTYRSMFT